MKSYGVTEARKRWSELLAKAEGGDEIFITRKGKMVAKLVSATDSAEERQARAAIEDRQEESVAHVPGEKSVRDMIEEA